MDEIDEKDGEKQRTRKKALARNEYMNTNPYIVLPELSSPAVKVKITL
jgi:hypothetical protein